MKDAFWIRLAQSIAARKHAGSGPVYSHRGRRGRQARPSLDALEERCLLSFGSPSLFDNGTLDHASNAAVAVGDVSGDTIPDLVTATTTGAITIAFGQLNPVTGKGDGTFDQPVTISTPAASFSAVKLTDLTGSGLLDIIAADPADNEAWVFLNGGGGNFGSFATYPTGSDPVSIAVAGIPPFLYGNPPGDLNGDTSADLNGDGFADIVTANQGDNTVSVLLGKGDGSFLAHTDYPVGTQPMQVALGDFNRDGKPDLVTANKAGNSVSVLLGKADGTFRPGLEIPMTVPAPPSGDTKDPLVSSPSGVAIGDFNGDGNLDLVTANSGQASVSIIMGNGDGSFGVEQTIDTLTFANNSSDPLAPDAPTAVAAGDFDGNGSVDIAFSEPKHGWVGVLSGKGDGTFATRVDNVAGESVAALVVANLNGDNTSLFLNRYDLVAVDPLDTRASVVLGQKYAIPTTLGIGTSTITYGASITVTPGATSGVAPPIGPIAGAFQLTVDGNPYGVPQPVGSSFVISGLPVVPNYGTHTLGAHYFGDLDYDPQDTSTVIIRVVPAKLTLTALDRTRTYGDVNPALTYSITGFVNSDFLDQSKLSGVPALSTAAVDYTSPAGIYPITVTPGTLNYNDTNYTIDTTQLRTGKLTIQPAPLTVAAANLVRLYGQPNPVLIPSYTGFVNGETLATSDLTGAPSMSTSATLNSSVVLPSGYPISIARGSLSSSNYSFTFSPGTLIIQPAVLTVTAANATRVYGAADPAFTSTITGFVNGETAVSGTMAGAPSFSTTAKASSSVGDYAITPGLGTLASTDYSFVFVPATLTVGKATLTVAARDSTRAYGITGTALGYSLSGFANSETAVTGGVTGSPIVSTTAQANSSPGTYPITIVQGSLIATNYNFQGFWPATLTITQAALIVQVWDQHRPYGTENPSFKDQFSLVREDQPQSVVSQGDAGLTVTLVLSTTAVVNSPQGSYPITVSQDPIVINNSNYYLDLANSVNGTLTITQATMVLTVAAVNTSRPYGGANPALTYTITGFISGETLASSGVTGAPILTTTCTAASSAGTYDITLTPGTLQATNYTFNLKAGTLTVTPAPLTVKAVDQARSYGDVNPGFTYGITGFVNGDFLDQSRLSGAPLLTTNAADNTSPVGIYPITVKLGTLSYQDTNYTIDTTQLQAGKLTVTPVPLTISTSSLTRPYGQANPALKFSYNGFVNGETSAKLAGTPSITTTGSVSSPAGSYPIVVGRGSLLSSNYTLIFQSATLTITPVVLLVTADDATRAYGAANPTVAYTVTGFVNGENLATSDVTGTPSNSTTATLTSPVIGRGYPITPTSGTLKSTDYTFSFQAGMLSITPALLTVAASDATRQYGIPNPTLPYTLTGFVNGETAATGGVTGTPSFSAPSATTSVGVYPNAITVGPGTLSATNYAFQGFLPATLTITQAALVVRVQDTTKSYGTANPVFTSTVVREDNLADISTQAGVWTGSPVLSTPAVVTSPVGVYPITVAAGNLGITNSNYFLDLANSLNGTLTITPATLVITANHAFRTYGAADPTFTYTMSGFIIGGTPDVTGQPSFGTTSVSSSHVGAYTVVPGTGSLSSQLYIFNFVPAEFDITRAPLVISANNTSQAVGADPRLSASYTGLVNGDTAASLATPAILTTTATNTSLPGMYPIGVAGATSSDYTISFVPGTLTVVKSQTISAFTGPIIRAAVAPPVVFVVRVGATGASSVPLTGVVRFYDGARVIADAPLVNGTATLSTSALEVGNHSITAVYQGDTNYAGSSAGPISQMVYSAAPAIRASRTAPRHPAAKKKTPPPPKHPAKRTPLPPKHPAKVVAKAASSTAHHAPVK